MKKLWNKIFIMLFVLVLLTGCGKSEVILKETVSDNESENDSKSLSATELFTRFLNDEITTKITISAEKQQELYMKDLVLKASGTSYCFVDVDGDGVEELNIKSAGYLYVIKAEENMLSVIYEGSYSFPVNNDGLCGILYAFPGGMPMIHYNYKFTTFSTDGTTNESGLFSWYDLNGNHEMDRKDSYSWMEQDVSQEEWLDNATPYITTTYDWITWKNEEPQLQYQEYFLESIPELAAYAEYIKTNSSKQANLYVSYEAAQLYELVEDDRVLGEYYMFYVGEEWEDHRVNWDWFYVRKDCGEILYYESITGDYLSLEEWRASEYYRTYLFHEIPKHSLLLDDFLQGKKEAYIYFDLIGDSSMNLPDSGEFASISDLVRSDGYYLYRDINGDGEAELHLLQPYYENDPSIGWCYVIFEDKGRLRLCANYYYPRSYPNVQDDYAGIILKEQERDENHISITYQLQSYDDFGKTDTTKSFSWMDINDNKCMDEADSYRKPDDTETSMEVWKNTTMPYENTLTVTDWTPIPKTDNFVIDTMKENAACYEAKPLVEADLQYLYNDYVIHHDTTMEDVFLTLGVPDGFEENNNGYISVTAYNNRYTNVNYPSFDESQVRMVFLSSFLTGPKKYYDNSHLTTLWFNKDSQTHRGLKLGDSIETVYELYGKPDCITTYSANNKRIELQYHNELGDLIIVLDETNVLVDYIFIEYHVKRSTDNEALIAYKDILNQYYAALTQQQTPSEFSEICASIDLYHSCYNHNKENLLSCIGYTFYDLNLDGKEELIIGQVQSTGDSDYEDVLWEVYTMQDEPVRILCSNARYLNYLTANNQIIEIWSGGSSNQGVSVYEFYPNDEEIHFVEGIEVDGEYVEPYFFTTSDKPYDFEKYTTITGTEYNTRRVIYGKSAVAISAVFMPFEEYVYQGE